MIEHEKKLLLEKEEYEMLLDIFCENVSPTRQVNYYFDTDDFYMNSKGITCRIRYKNGEYKAVMKTHRKAYDECSLETTMKIRRGLRENDFTDMGLSLQGCLITERVVMLKTDFHNVVLDKNTYLGYIDYELEIEYLDGFEDVAEQIKQRIIQLLLKNCKSTTFNSITLRNKHVQSKSERFFERRVNT